MSMPREQVIGIDPGELREHRGWFVALGILFVILGIVAIVAAFAATLATVLFFGVLMLLAGVVQVVHAISATKWRGFLLHLLGGILYLGIGGLIVYDPVGGAVALTLFLAAFFLVAGVMKLVLGIYAESGWFALNGIVDLLLGGFVWMGWPETGTWVIGLFLGIELVLAGISLILVASALGPKRPPAPQVATAESGGERQ
jgi:uncharacterized membrane protein HdeD (DUF308 family)